MGDPSADDEGRRSQPAMRSPLSLRPYQHEAVDAVQAAVERGVQRPMVVLPTGCGKTVLFAALIARRGGSALVLAHRDELLRQAAEKIAIADPTLALGVGFVAAQRNDVGSPVVVGSVQTLARANRLARLPKQFDTVVVDEAHHASARSYRRILEYLSPSPLILGVTATPARADGKQLGDVWQEIVYQRGIAEMIRAGYLADIRGVRVGLEQVKLDEVEQSAGDFDANALGKVLERASAPLHVLTAYRQHATGRKAIVFVPTVALAHRMATVFREAGIRAEALDGSTPWEQRRAILARLHRGQTRVVTNVGVLSEGVDVPSVDAIVMASPTRSQVKYCLDAKSEALTPAGFRKGAELKVGDLVASYDRRTRCVRWEPITAHIARPFDPVGERMFALQSGTIDLRVTGDHRMVWTDRRSKRARVTSAAELSERRDEWRLPVAGYQEAPGVALSDDELRFIGWWLTDGTINRANGTVMITQSHRYQEHVAAIDACLAGCRLQHRRHEQAERGDEGFRTHYGQTKWVIQRTSLGAMAGWRGYEELAPWLDKDLSPALEYMTRDQLAVLLHAMHLGDGDKHDRLQSWTQRTYCIGTARRLLADRLQSLCVRRGMRCNISMDPRPERTQTYWHIHVRVDRDYRTVTGRTAAAREPGRPTLRETGGSAGEVVWCITVPSGAFITRRNNKTAVVGNSQAVGRGLRTFPGKEDCLVIDLVGESERLDLQTPAAAVQPARRARARGDSHRGAGARAAGEGGDRPPPGAGAPEGRGASRGRRGRDAGRGVAKPAREHARGPSADGSSPPGVLVGVAGQHGNARGRARRVAVASTQAAGRRARAARQRRRPRLRA